mmetsp:Transcript_36151/g.81254  ORF Transcript_36151/g.81254 Transcript_36151/m.81254 type:complete len:94 (+) Transcript_36151:360-641(+)
MTKRRIRGPWLVRARLTGRVSPMVEDPMVAAAAAPRVDVPRVWSLRWPSPSPSPSQETLAFPSHPPPPPPDPTVPGRRMVVEANPAAALAGLW